MPHELIPNTISRELIEACETMTERARRGHLIGLVFGAIFKGRRYTTGWAGSVDRYPTHALGVVSMLQGELEDLIHDRDPDDER